MLTWLHVQNVTIHGRLKKSIVFNFISFYWLYVLFYVFNTRVLFYDIIVEPYNIQPYKEYFDFVFGMHIRIIGAEYVFEFLKKYLNTI